MNRASGFPNLSVAPGLPTGQAYVHCVGCRGQSQLIDRRSSEIGRPLEARRRAFIGGVVVKNCACRGTRTAVAVQQ